MKKIICVTLVVCLLLAMLPTALTAASAENDGKTAIIYTGNLRGNINILPQLVTLRNQLESQGMDVILVDTGNYLQGTIYSALDSGRTVIELMDKAGYNVVAIGSHEFDFGTGVVGVETHGIIFADDSLGQLLEDASFSAVSANVVAGPDAISAFLPYTVVTTASGRRVGFFGLTNPGTVGRVLESNLDGFTFQNPVTAAAQQVTALANADLVVGLSNAGLRDTVPGAILIDVAPRLGLTVGVLTIDAAGSTSHSFVNLAELTPDTEMLVAVNYAREAAGEAFPAFAQSRVTLEGTFVASRSGETNLGNLWTDALLWFANEGGIANFFDEDEIDAGNTGIMVEPENVVAIWNGGNLRDFLNTGDVTMRDLQRVLPFPNRVAVMYLTGAQLLEMLEAATQGLPFSDATFAAAASFPHVAGMEFLVDTSVPFDAGEAYGQHWYRANSIGRVTIDSINGNDFDPDATYAIITSNAIFNGMDSNYISLERCQEYSIITSALVVDVVWMYIMQQLDGIIDARYAAPQGRITIR